MYVIIRDLRHISFLKPGYARQLKHEKTWERLKADSLKEVYYDDDDDDDDDDIHQIHLSNTDKVEVAVAILKLHKYVINTWWRF